jgi:small subunit ribosomal protein S17
MDKTVVVVVERVVPHPLYKRRIRRSTRLKAHDERNECRIGDTVRIEETRPLSKDKHWRVVEIVQRGAE